MPSYYKTTDQLHVTWFEKLFSRLEVVVSSYFTGALIAFTCAFVGLEVLARAITNYSFASVIDIVMLCMVVITYTSLSIVQRDDGHLKVDLIRDKLYGKRVGYAVESLLLLLSLAVAGILGYATLRQTLIFYNVHQGTSSVDIPLWWAAIFMPIGFLLLAIRYTLQMKQMLMTLMKGR